MMKPSMNSPFALCRGSELLFGDAESFLRGICARGRVVVVADARVAEIYAPLLRGVEHLAVQAGEAEKSVDGVAAIWRYMMERGADRHSTLVAIGGGVVCDMAAFAAATYMRGVRFVLVPTTLLAQVDAAVGGKNGVNFGGYKNMVGCFAQPASVLVDTRFPATLSDREFRSGLAEVVKSAVVGDAELFEELERMSAAGLRGDTVLLERMVCAAVRVKVAIVEADEREAGMRRLLNLGHTAGHAIEHCACGFTHGEAVATGMAVIARAAAAQGLFAGEECRRLVALLEKFGFAASLPVAAEELAAAIEKDKKRNGANVALVVPRAVGRCEIREVPMAGVAAWLRY